VTESAGLEDGYRRLLAWYPLSFREEQEDEMLAVLMAGAEPGQRRPGRAETADLLWSAVRMRVLRALRPGPVNQGWATALAAFGVLTPAFLVIVAALEVAWPDHLPVLRGHASLVIGPPRRHPEVGGPSLLGATFFDVAIGIQIVVAALALLGRRRLALLGMLASVLFWLAYWTTGRFGISGVLDALQLLTASGYLIGGAALLVSPDAERGWRLLSWRHWAVLVSAAALVQVSTFLLDQQDAVRLFFLRPPPDITGYVVLTAILAVATAALVLILRLSWYFLLLLAVLFYPYATQLAVAGAFRSGGFGTNLLRLVTPGHEAMLFVPPALLACVVLLIAVWPRLSSVSASSGREA
jgi:hypothetical protein